MTSWVEIESSARPSQVAATASTIVTKLNTQPRLRRTEQLVVGSIDTAAHIFQRRARQVVLGSAVLLVPMVGLHLLLTVLAFDQYQHFDSFLGDRGYVGVETGLVLLGLVVQSLSAHLIGAYTAAYLVPYQMGGEPRAGACLRRVMRKLPVLLLTWALTHWPTLLTMWWFVTIAPAQVVGLAWVMLLLLMLLLALFSAMSLVVAPVVMTEQLGVRAIARAWRLARTRFGAAFGFVLACGLLGAMMAAFIAFLPQLAKSTGFITFGSFGWLVQGVTTQLAMLIVLPFVAIATSQMYLQLRVHAEGLDIAIAADRVFGPAAAQGAT